MNNKPITARVKSGMFKTKEPLLNVGPAGVDGNNTTRTMPSPSKMKGYKMKSSPFKQETTGEGTTDNAETSAQTENNATIEMSSEKENAGVKANTNQESTVIQKGGRKKGKEITRTKDFDKNWDESKYGPYDEWIKKPGNKAKSDAFIATQQEPTGTFEPDTVEPDKVVKTNKKGTSKIYEQSEGRAQSAYDRRNNARAGRRTDREVNRASRKLGKYGTYDQDGKFTQRENLSQREIRKMGIAKNALDRANKESENVSQQSLQNVGGFSGKDVKNVDRRKTKGSYTPEEQANMPDEVRNKTSFSKFKAKKETMDPISFTPMSQKELSAGLESRGEAPKEKQSSFEKSVMDSPFFKKKSPIKMNYFKK